MKYLGQIKLRVIVVGWIGCQCLGGGMANFTASLGGNTAGSRGSVRVVFINNTSNRTIFTTGMYDQTDQDTRPDFVQFGGDNSEFALNENATSEILELSCARVFAIGSPRLLNAIQENLPEDASDPIAAVSGVQFLEPPVEGMDESIPPELVGTAPPFEALLGVDFPCNALLILRFEADDTGSSPFRIDFELIPSESNR